MKNRKIVLDVKTTGLNPKEGQTVDKKYIARSMQKTPKFSSYRQMNSKIPGPRNAASLILLKGDNKDIKVLLGKRSSKARFMPGAWVFPGGVIDKKDFKQNITSSLDPKIIKKLAVANNFNFANALAVTAIRETAEETGLLLGKFNKNVPNKNLDLQNGIDFLASHNLVPDLSKISYLGRAITPTFSPIRFHARFFVADSIYLKGKIQTTNELVEIDWISVQQARELPMADVTEFMIQELLSFNAKISTLKKRLDDRPMFTWKNGKQWITRR